MVMIYLLLAFVAAPFFEAIICSCDNAEVGELCWSKFNCIRWGVVVVTGTEICSQIKIMQ